MSACSPFCAGSSTTWHIGWWWTEALAAGAGRPGPAREDVTWPGTGAAATAWIKELAVRWRTLLHSLPDLDLDRTAPFPWPNRPDRTIAHMVFWVNGELMKNAAEIGQLRLMHAAVND